MKDIIRDSLERILADTCAPAVVRQIEETGASEVLWSQIEETGFLDALVPEEAGGAGLALADTLPVPDLIGRYAVPVPVTETMILRGLLARAGIPVPSGSLSLAIGRETADGGLRCSQVPLGRVADHILVETSDEMRLLAHATATIQPAQFTLDADMAWGTADVSDCRRFSLDVSVRVIQAFIYAAQLGGAFAAVFERTLDYANQRQQFGKPIGKFQAIQHQLALMAEQVFSARMAVELTTALPEDGFNASRIAVAKARTSEAAVEIGAIAHAIHGAIGFTEEYDLQLLTRRMNTWRLAAGSESYWFAQTGATLIADPRPQSLDTLRELSSS